jgi:plastocyanin
MGRAMSDRHTFTIDELGVDLSIPPNSEQRVTFDAPAGSYEFECRPHTPGMTGTLTVR